MKEQQTFEVENCEVISETEGALLVQGPKGSVLETAEWIPKSQITDDSEGFEKDTEGLLIVTEWIAKKKDWI